MVRSSPASDVVVIGAGITGVSAALELAERGARVTLVDGYGPAAMASGWTLAGVRQSGRHPAELPLALRAVQLWQQLSETLGSDTGYRQKGNLRLARTPEEVPVIRDLVANQSAAGLPITFLSDLHEVREVAPALSDTVQAASFCATDGHADPVLTVKAYVKKAESLGVETCFGEKVTGLEVSGGRVVAVETASRSIACGAVLLATGILANELLAPLGAEIPLRRPIVTVLRSAVCEPLLEPVLGVANADMAARQEAGGRMRVTSGAQFGDWTMASRDGWPAIRPTMNTILETIETVRTVLPAFGALALENAWAGALDLTPDALPVIDRVPALDNLTVAAGFSGHGFGIGPVTGPLAAQIALGMEAEMDVSAFRFDRFSTTAQAEASLTLHG